MSRIYAIMDSILTYRKYLNAVLIVTNVIRYVLRKLQTTRKTLNIFHIVKYTYFYVYLSFILHEHIPRNIDIIKFASTYFNLTD